ncbi:MAG: ABC transporter substrate-binding protein [Acutalibacteraceae bacterium]
MGKIYENPCSGSLFGIGSKCTHRMQRRFGSQTTSGSSVTATNIDSRVFNYGVTAYSGAQANGSIDLHLSYAGWSTVRYGVGECLVKISEEGTIEPWVADNWTLVDDTTWEINIKDNVTFSNGKKVDAAAVKACFERLIEKNERAASGLKISSMEADGQKLTIHTSEKNPILINWLTDPFACVIDVSEEVNGNNHVIGTNYIIGICYNRQSCCKSE